jgi:hypothetical protein
MPLDECQFLPYPETPHPVLPITIHNPHTGQSDSKTGGGLCEGYAHTTSIDVFHPQKSGAPAYKLENIPVDFMPGLDVVLLGVKSFLSEFIITIDYPRYKFSIKRPEVDRRDTP